MKKQIISAFFLLLFMVVSCNAKTDNKQQVSGNSGNDVEVYYFHTSIRCVTCKTVEAETRKDIEMLYPAQVKEGKISFIALNLDEETGRTTGERMGVTGQTLLIVKGDQKINLTNEGFLYAVSKPDKFKEIIREKVDPLLK